jgi:hypothetical protein
MNHSRNWLMFVVALIASLYVFGGGAGQGLAPPGAAPGGIAVAQQPAAHDALLWDSVTTRGLGVARIYRAKVPGGWLVSMDAQSFQPGNDTVAGLTFVPDPDHKWTGASLK